jgi:hypothetical protein
MTDTIYIFHHLGLGDHIICNGLVRNVCRKIKNVNLFAKPEYHESVTFMFKDLKNLNVIAATDEEAHVIWRPLPIEQKVQPATGKRRVPSMLFDEVFYTCIGLNFQRRWDDFFFERDKKREKNLTEKLVKSDNYIFVHDDSTRNFYIPDSELSGDFEVVRPVLDITNNIFDYTSIIENAKEIHVMDSCFKHLAESIPVNAEKFFYYTSIRGRGVDNKSNSRKNWIEK